MRACPAGAALALPKAVQRHAIKGVIEHVDLIEVRRGEKVTVEIPIRVTGDVFSGGMLDQQMVQISVEAEATHLPDGVDVDVEGAEVGTQVFAKDLALPDGTTLVTDPEALVLHVVAPQTQAAFDAEIGEAEETEAPAEVRAGRRAPPRPSNTRDPTGRAAQAAPRVPPASWSTLTWLTTGGSSLALATRAPSTRATGITPGRWSWRCWPSGWAPASRRNRTRNDIAEGRLAGQPATLARPQSYMNLSGGPVAALLGFYKLSPERAVVHP